MTARSRAVVTSSPQLSNIQDEVVYQMCIKLYLNIQSVKE